MKSLFRFVGLILKGIWKAITFIRLALTNLIFLLSIGIIYFIYIHADARYPPWINPRHWCSICLARLLS